MNPDSREFSTTTTRRVITTGLMWVQHLPEPPRCVYGLSTGPSVTTWQPRLEDGSVGRDVLKDLVLIVNVERNPLLHDHLRLLLK